MFNDDKIANVPKAAFINKSSSSPHNKTNNLTRSFSLVKCLTT